MQIHSAEFIKGVVGNDEIFEDGTPLIVFIGRSNAGKSSVINSIANRKKLAISSAAPGRTRMINIFRINKLWYLIDLPGYGFARMARAMHEHIEKMINWFLFASPYAHKKVVVVIDANVGLTSLDLEMLMSLENAKKDVVIVANKIDKIKKSEYDKKFADICEIAGQLPVIPFSAEKRIGVGELVKTIFS